MVILGLAWIRDSKWYNRLMQRHQEVARVQAGATGRA